MTTSKLLFYMNMRDPDAIVGVDAFGELTRLTADDFPSEEEFRRIKAWSDEDYRRSYLADRREENNTVANDDVHESELTVASYEETIISEEIRKYEHGLCELIIPVCPVLLNESQLKRFFLYLDGYTEAAIAEIEGVTKQAISKTLLCVMNILRSWLKEHHM